MFFALFNLVNTCITVVGYLLNDIPWTHVFVPDYNQKELWELVINLSIPKFGYKKKLVASNIFFFVFIISNCIL